MRRRQPKEQTSKILTFAYEDLHLGLSVERVQKVLRLPQIHKTSSAPLGIALVGEEEVLVLDLYQNLFQQDMPHSQDPREKRYFITIRHDEILYGIPTLSMPILQEIPLSALKTTPSQYRDHDALGVASHVFQSGGVTYFLLDPHSLWQALVAKQNIQHSLAQVLEASELDNLPNLLDDFAETASQNPTPTLTGETESMQVFNDFDEPIDTLSEFLDDFGNTEPAIAVSQNQSMELSDADNFGISLESTDDDSFSLNFDDFSDFEDDKSKTEIPHSTSASQEG
jgi:chemotaxis signal transduction protein